MLNLGVIGYGYWGPNIVRNFFSCPGINLKRVCDLSPERLAKVTSTYPSIQTTHTNRDITTATDIDAVAIITPVSTHYEIARECLENGKHIFVEKPFTSSVAEALELVNLAEKKNLLIMVDHTFLFTSAVKKMRELITQGVLGDLYYIDSTRVNLGLFQMDTNVVWDLAPHDLAIINYLTGQHPHTVLATGIDHFHQNSENLAYITLFYENNFMAHLNVNWLSPVKIRNTLVGGSKKMLVWNDLDNEDKIKIYDKGVELHTKEKIYQALFSYRSGDMISPNLNPTEALSEEARYFVQCIDSGTQPINNGWAGLKVVEILAATDQSLRNKSIPIKIPSLHG